ncbi:putative C6 finger domain protein [Lepidopterella palustris CBS 459.81]|uniref:Putative C6 finger domain protein n=1 Tax=Lepidopterella palustris CBS 459.81 TaxID=1314670 RepID=A0A8E2E030_9PEZI|nr:putative C6 finger domain protein [Lepidopterella palustris CBS 459.81]
MTKRSLDSSNEISPPRSYGDGRDVIRGSTQTTLRDQGSNGGGSVSEGSHGSGDLKRPRSFMATLACETCRIKKTRCDEDRPRCGLCKALDLPCNYPEARITKKDQSMSVAINAIRRLEAKIEDLSKALQAPPPTPIPQTLEQFSPHSVNSQSFSSATPGRASTLLVHDAHETINDIEDSSPGINDEGHPVAPNYSGSGRLEQKPISFSQHRVMRWPAIMQVLPRGLLAACENLNRDYVVDLEVHRPPLPFTTSSFPKDAGEQWLSKLPLSLIKGLVNAYFAVFNRITPVLDKFHFFSSTLGTAMENDFGYDVESCLVLNVLALGCLAVRAYEEGNYPLPTCSSAQPAGTGNSNQYFHRPDWYEVIAENPPGLRFFNEARKRTGFLLCDNELPNCQFYMLSGVYYAQIVRAIDSWTMVNRAALCCLTLLKRNKFINCDDWEADMKSRVFWNILMYETILIQELNLPLSGLAHYEAEVPIPKFTPFPRPRMEETRLAALDEDDSFFNFHFLAQVANRIILTRIRHSLYFYSEQEEFPPPVIESELRHQLDQWRSNLPAALQFSDDDDANERPPSPAHVVAQAMLKSRYQVARFHMSRPFLYKAFHAPALTTEHDLHAIRDGLKSGMYWPATTGLCKEMKSAQPLKFGWCCQFFGQVLIFHGVAHSPDPRLRQTLPAGWEGWVRNMMELLEYCAAQSPAIEKDLELLRLL